MDVEEFDRNDNTQELQLNMSRGNVGDLVVGAAAGISSGTRKVQPKLDLPNGEPQDGYEFSGTNVSESRYAFEVEDNPNNYRMIVRAGAGEPVPGDCKLQLYYEGEPFGEEVDPGSVGDYESIVVSNPKPGSWEAVIRDFAGCVTYDGTVTFSNGQDELPTKGAADTWSNWSRQPTGWAFTNVGPKDVEGIASSTDSNGTENITLDVMRYGSGDVDVSPGFAQGGLNAPGGFGPVNVGRSNPMHVPVINHGGKATGTFEVTVRDGAPDGPVVVTKSVTLGAYERKDMTFNYRPKQEGHFDLFVTVDEGGKLAEKHEGNNTQKATGWAGPANPRVLVVDDDAQLTSEKATIGALAALGVPYAVMQEHPTAAQLKQYEAVIWEAGVDRLQGQFNKDDRSALKSYLDGGGKVLLQSNRVASALGTSQTGNEDTVDFFKNYFGGTYGGSNDTISQEVSTEIVGAGGLFGSMKAEIVPFAARQFIETIIPAEEDVFGTVKPELNVPAMAENDERHLGVSVAGDSAHKGFKTVTLGYNWTQHANADTTTSMLRSVLGFFGVQTGGYEVDSEEPIVYHSTVRDQVSGRKTPINAVVLGGKPNRPVSLHYRRHNLGGFHEQQMTKGSEPGSYTGMLPPFALTPDGVDYYLKAGTATTYEPRLVALGRLTHSIGVQLPEISGALPILPGGLKNVPDRPQRPTRPDRPQEPNRPDRPTEPTTPATGMNALAPVAAMVLLGSAVLVRRRTAAG
jgi:hypothetical protein